MKSFILAIIIFSFTLESSAQCEKVVQLTSSRTDYLDADGNLQNSRDEKSRVEISKTTLVITPGEDQQMKGEIKSYTCDWKIPYKDGKMIIKALLSDQEGEQKNLTITIEGKEGKLTFLGEIEEMPGRKIKLILDTFEEKK